jgi:ribonuclease HI
VKVKWGLPYHDHLKINTDTSFVEANNQGCTGLVVRDNQGKLITEARWFEYAATAIVMEAYAIREGLCLATDFQYPSIIIESGGKRVVKY